MSHPVDRTLYDVRGKLVTITGASAGIGAATAEMFAAAGANVALVARREERIRALADHLADTYGVDVAVVPLDVTDPESIQELVADPDSALAETDILVNNAGLAKGTDPIQSADPADWQTMIDTNVMGLLRMTRAIIPHMMARGDGHVINIGSVAGRWVYPGGGVYCATKHAVKAISEGLRMDIIGSRIRVTNIEPGLVETEFSVVRLGDDDKAAKVYDRMTPLVAADIADAIVYCATRPPHVNIQEMVIFPTDQAAITQVHRYDA